MRRLIEFLVGIVLVLGSILGMILARNQQVGSCLVVGGSILNYIIVYSIVIILAVLGILYLIKSYK